MDTARTVACHARSSSLSRRASSATGKSQRWIDSGMAGVRRLRVDLLGDEGDEGAATRMSFISAVCSVW